MEELDAPDDKVELRESKVPEIRLSKLRMEKQDKSPAVHGATLRVPFRDLPAVWFREERENFSEQRGRILTFQFA